LICADDDAAIAAAKQLVDGHNIELWRGARKDTTLPQKTDETIHSLVRNSDAAARYGNGEMCEKCVEIDAKIERYRNIVRSITDQPTVDGTKALIADLEAQKAVLHPQREQ
jgi:hypothetical protein